ncbi:MAG: HAD family hydrolase [Chloroflexi bacterium]|jgi:pyrophosphatase PpaX|nr:HAD family hydrolase [Chloroflexota bacterium]
MRAVLFDWDGTLVDTLDYMWEATEVVTRRHGLAIDEARYRAEFTPDWRLLYRRFGMAEDEIEQAGHLWWSVYRGHHEAALLPGARRAVARLRRAGFLTGLVTAGHRENVEQQLVRHRMADLLPVRVFGDEGAQAKPHPEPLRRALRALGIRVAAEAAYVGDSFDDLRMAVAVGARPVGITSVLGDDAALRAAGAADVAGSVGEWVDRLLGPDRTGRAVAPAPERV